MHIISLLAYNFAGELEEKIIIMSSSFDSLRKEYNFMTKDIANTDIELKSNTDFYKDMLKSHVLGSDPLPQIPEAEMERYISVFSLYLRASNEAYKYNLPYLSNQHKGYFTFLISAPKKAKKLLNIIKSVNESEVITDIIDNNNIAKDEIILSLNDFLSADLSEKIDFHKSFSLFGAIRRKEDDLVTLEYRKQVRVVKLSGTKESDLIKIASVVEKILITSLNKEVTDIVDAEKKAFK